MRSILALGLAAALALGAAAGAQAQSALGEHPVVSCSEPPRQTAGAGPPFKTELWQAAVADLSQGTSGK